MTRTVYSDCFVVRYDDERVAAHSWGKVFGDADEAQLSRFVLPSHGGDRIWSVSQENSRKSDDLFASAWRDAVFHRPPPFSFPRVDPNHDEIETQVEELRADAVDESEAFNEDSANALLDYCHALAADIEPAIFRLANGNLRAVWQNRRMDQIAIQFLPDGQLQFIILRDRRGRTLKTLGVEDADTIEQIVGVVRLRSLWFRG